ncbi:hypothetical protein B4U80_09542, partial [Leptotrombidium deliense]
FYGLKIGFCGGSIIDNLPFIPIPVPVTHYNISIGERNLNDPNDGQKYYISTKAIVHQNYAPCSDSFGNDIALLKIAGEGMNVPYISDNGLGSTNCICLPSPTTNYTGNDVITAGWGRTNKNNDNTASILQYATIKVVSDSDCSATYGSSYDSKTMMCAYASGKSSCNGDSGTALFTPPTTTDAYAAAVGITSFGRQNCEGYPVVYTRVSTYLDFINSNKGQMNQTKILKY